MLGWPWGVIIKWLLQSRGCYYSAATVCTYIGRYIEDGPIYVHI